MDLTLVKLPVKQQPEYHTGDKLIACYVPYKKRFQDNSIDMGTGFDCFDRRAYPSSHRVSNIAHEHGMRLRKIMNQHGFRPYKKEWWHFTLRNEP